ncbi:hypothetical protein MNB_SV-9-768 [hydrothermal vent metagenome]|uniref:CBS domain-containing protein n=1 Tax=hydrothermal vent metagenome TaxID=652676 RepID=A0A1W1C3P0_9ZZZZ
MNPRNRVAYFTLIISSLAIFLLASITIIKGDVNVSMTIFNTTLPVFASWIGTVLAFYFGRENFESANKQVQHIVTNLTQIKSQKSIDTIMLTPYAMTIFKIEKDKSIENITLSELQNTFLNHRVSRLPIINFKNQIEYLIHQSKMNSYLLNKNVEAKDISLAIFLQDNREDEGDDGKRFILVSKNTPLEETYKRLQKCKKCKDIFVTENGKEEEEILGWVPDVHLLEEDLKK